MTVYLSPSSGVSLLSSSLGTLYPIEDENGGDRVTYFIYYSHGADVGPWEFSLELVVCLLLWLHLRYKDMNKQNIQIQWRVDISMGPGSAVEKAKSQASLALVSGGNWEGRKGGTPLLGSLRSPIF